ncbi:MAG: DUF2723 domain-containing protein [Candidatus Sumerlaeaceae bacterium]|nr:DUF2723 domain-containing protein [Candidatus Sumerlaeaceae bacterium]
MKSSQAMPDWRWQAAGAFCVAVTAFLVYLMTLNPRLQFGDGPELAAAAYVLGVPHATGYPLYMLLLKCFTALPFGEVITRTTLASAAFMSLACAAASLVLMRAISRLLPFWQARAVAVTSVAGGLTTAFLFDTWNQATQTEVYALQFLLMMIFVVLAQHYLTDQRPRSLAVLGLVCGLGLAHHRLSVCLVAGLLYLSWMHVATATIGANGSGAYLWQRVRRWLEAVAAWMIAAACLGLYAYLPLRARTSPPVNFGDPRTPAAFWEHVRGAAYFERFFLRPIPGQEFTPRQYAQFAASRSVDLAGRMADMLFPFRFSLEWDPLTERWSPRPEWPARWAGLVIAILGAAGLVLLARCWPSFAASLMMVAAPNVAVAYLYSIPDIADYLLFPLWVAGAGAGMALMVAARSVGRFAPHFQRPGTAWVSWILPAALLVANLARCDRSSDFGAEHYSALIMPESKVIMPHGSILLTGGDNDHFTCLYRQVARAERTDVLVFSAPSISLGWYARMFTPAQHAEYRLRFANSLPLGPLAFVKQLADGVIDANLGRHDIFTSITDRDVLASLDRRYGLEAVASRTITGLSPYLRETTATLYRILPERRKERAP